MPPKVKISKQDIIDTALALLREGGEGAVNARSIAAALGCSTQPIFSNFSSMEELEESVTLAAYECYLGALAREARSGKYPAYNVQRPKHCNQRRNEIVDKSRRRIYQRGIERGVHRRLFQSSINLVKFFFIRLFMRESLRCF